MEVLRNRRGGARVDWLCGRWALHSQRLLVLQQKLLDTGIFCLLYLGLLNRRTTRTQSPKSQKRISGAQPETVAFTLPTTQCAPRRVIQHFCISLKSRRPIRSFASGNSPIKSLSVFGRDTLRYKGLYGVLPFNPCAKAISAVTQIMLIAGILAYGFSCYQSWLTNTL